RSETPLEPPPIQPDRAIITAEKANFTLPPPHEYPTIHFHRLVLLQQSPWAEFEVTNRTPYHFIYEGWVKNHPVTSHETWNGATWRPYGNLVCDMGIEQYVLAPGETLSFTDYFDHPKQRMRVSIAFPTRRSGPAVFVWSDPTPPATGHK